VKKGRNSVPLIKSFNDLAAEARARIREISPEEVADRLRDRASGWVLIDVRENDEYRAGHLPGALGIGRGILEYHIADVVPDTDTEIVLYCRGAKRSALAAASLQEMGYTAVASMSGGFREWIADASRPVTREGDPIVHQ
jgi:rhodanese-related sulfurtransferase